MSHDFGYIINSIKNANILTEPFPHIHVNNLFHEHHFRELTNCHEIYVEPTSNDSDLILSLEEKGYKSIKFPGSLTSKDEYVEWHSRRQSDNLNVILDSKHSACEGVGYVMRLFSPSSQIIKDIQDFFGSNEFIGCIADKFSIENKITYDGGIQKYLDGYEISPHPDIRKKAGMDD